MFVLLDRGEEYKNMNEKITVYSKPGCGQCMLTKRLLSNEGIDFKEVDVIQDGDALAHIQELGYGSLPVIEYGEIHFGYDKDKLQSLVAELKV